MAEPKSRGLGARRCPFRYDSCAAQVEIIRLDDGAGTGYVQSVTK
jgi:hypothetical protein